MHRFAFVIHPLEARDLAKKYPIARFLPANLIEAFAKRKHPFVASHITGVRSLTGAETEGWFIALPLTAHQLISLPHEFVYERLLECCKLAKAEGAEIIGLGAFTSVAGDGGITVAKSSPVAVTTGNSYTVATAIEGTLKACDMLGIDPTSSKLAVVGATGSIGKTCAVVLSEKFGQTILIGRDLARTQAIADDLTRATATTDLNAIRDADAIITVTSADSTIIEPSHLKPGCVICDVARPRDVSVRVAKERPDVLVIEGGVVKVPGDVDFGVDFGFPPKTAYACMSETMMLALDARIENFTLGKDVSVAQVEQTFDMAKKHGFTLAGFRSFEREVSQETIERVRQARGPLQPKSQTAAV